MHELYVYKIVNEKIKKYTHSESTTTNDCLAHHNNFIALNNMGFVLRVFSWSQNATLAHGFYLQISGT